MYLTPEERPANAPVPQVDFNNGAGGDFTMPIEPQAAFGGQMPFAFRNFGNGVIVGGGEGMANMPNGVSMSVQKQEGQPTHITVKRGEETWEVVGDDPESLKQLPEDLRPFVERMMHGHGGMKIDMPNFDRRIPGPEIDDGRLRDRLERMEQRLEELHKRLSGEDHADKSNEKQEATK